MTNKEQLQEMEDVITKEQFDEWEAHPVTIEISKRLVLQKDMLESKLKNGYALGSIADETHGNTNRMLGHIEGLNQILNISYGEEDGSDERI